MRSLLFNQKPNEAFNEHGNVLKDFLVNSPHHGFSRTSTQLDTFYNSLNSNDQDALDSAAGGNFLDKMPQEGLAIIESKSKVRYSRSRANDSRVSTDAPLSNSSSSNNSFDMQQIAASLEDKMTIKMNKMLNEMKALVVTTPAPVKAVEEQINAITTRSGKILEEPSIPLVPTPDVLKPQKEPEQNPETSTEKVQNPKLENTAHVPSSGEEDSNFMEFQNPKSKENRNLDPNPNSYPSKLHNPKNEIKNTINQWHTQLKSDDPSPSSSPVKTSDNFVKIADELAPLNSLPPVFSSTLLYPTRMSVMPPKTINERSMISTIEVSSNLEKIFQSEGDIAFLDNLLSDDDSKVTSDHEPEQNESSITFSPRSDPLHHEFAGEPLTLPARNNREFEEYLSLMNMLNECTTSQGNFKSKFQFTVWICQILQEISQKRTRERMSDQEAKEIKAEAREIMPQPSTVNCS
ncbi:hypothetical protein Tco_0557422 [Tanacetum coccineum]